MTKKRFGLEGESLVAEELDTMGIRYWWNPSQQNYYGADFLTEYGVIDVKIAEPQTIDRLCRKSNRVEKRIFWKFNCHHHGKKQKHIDFFIFVVRGYRNAQNLYFIMPEELCGGYTFSISARQIETGRFDYFLNAWGILSGLKSKKIPNTTGYPSSIKPKGVKTKIKPKGVKTKIKRLIKCCGGRVGLAQELKIDLSYIYKFEKGVVPGSRLFRDICELYDDRK